MWFGEPHPFPERESPTILSASGQQRQEGWSCRKYITKHGPLDVKCKEAGILYLDQTVPDRLNSRSYRLSKTTNAYAAPIKFNAISQKEGKFFLTESCTVHKVYAQRYLVTWDISTFNIFPYDENSVCNVIFIKYSGYHSSNGLLLQSINPYRTNVENRVSS
jgi:hypothetical protein